MDRREFLHKIRYIDWKKEAEVKRISINEAEEKIEFLKKNGHRAKSMTKREDWLEDNTWSVIKDGYWRSLAVVEDEKYVRYVWNSADDDKNRPEYVHKGPKAAKLFNQHFQERTGITLRGAFGYTPEEDEVIKDCVPRPVYYINDFFNRRICQGVSFADFSSNYPSQLQGDLPDIRTAIRVEGEVDPTEEYPFAFYDNRHCAEYGRFDTRKYESYGKIARRLIYNDSRCRYRRYVGNPTFTILVKRSKYRLDEDVQHFYKLKEEGDPDAKIVMNATIGMFHQKKNDSYRLPHVAAICIGRANQVVIEAAVARIGTEHVLQIIVDGIIYFEDGQKTDRKKKLGAFVKEIHNARFRMIGINQYMFIDPKTEEVLDIKAAAFNSPDIERSKTFKDMDAWHRIQKGKVDGYGDF